MIHIYASVIHKYGISTKVCNIFCFRFYNW